METRAQGAIEYLLIIGAAVIIAVIVIALMMGLAGQGTQATEEAGVRKTYSELELFKISQQTGLLAGQEIDPEEEEKLSVAMDGLYHLNGTYENSYGTENDATVIIEPPTQTTGLWDTLAYFFPGDDDFYLEVNRPSRSTEETYSVWFKPETYSTVVMSFIAGKDNGGNDPTDGMHARGTLQIFSDGRLFVNSGSYGGGCWGVWPAIVSKEKVLLNKWNHAVFSIDFDTNYTLKLYLNGKFIGVTNPDPSNYKPINPSAQGTYQGSCSNDNRFMWIGRRKTGSSSFKGTIDEVGIWNRILSDQEINNLFIKGAAVLK